MKKEAPIPSSPRPEWLLSKPLLWCSRSQAVFRSHPRTKMNFKAQVVEISVPPLFLFLYLRGRVLFESQLNPLTCSAIAERTGKAPSDAPSRALGREVVSKGTIFPFSAEPGGPVGRRAAQGGPGPRTRRGPAGSCRGGGASSGRWPRCWTPPAMLVPAGGRRDRPGPALPAAPRRVRCHGHGGGLCLRGLSVPRVFASFTKGSRQGNTLAKSLYVIRCITLVLSTGSNVNGRNTVVLSS